MATISTSNYTLGGIDLYFDASIAHASLLDTTGTVSPGSNFRTSARSVGNIVSAEFNPDVTYLDHWISVRGSRRKDKTQPVQKAISINFQFDEVNGDNIKRFFLASKLGTNKYAVMEKPLLEGAVSMVFWTDVGTQFVYNIPKATIRPDGAMAMNTEDWWTGPMVLEVLFYNTGHYASKPYGVIKVI